MAADPHAMMLGPYSIHQMDDFYVALSLGQVKATGIMNYVQRVYIANRCPPGAKVVDICCGRGLQLPVLYRYASHIDCYAGLDVAAINLDEARQRAAQLDRVYERRPFTVQFMECDVSTPWPTSDPYDVAIYTSALEHMPRARGIASLQNAARALASDGRLYLSTPNTSPNCALQHRVHVYEWAREELQTELSNVGLVIDEMLGLLPPQAPTMLDALSQRFGRGAAAWYQRLQATIPGPFLDTVLAAAVPDVAIEVLYVCSRTPR